MLQEPVEQHAQPIGRPGTGFTSVPVAARPRDRWLLLIAIFKLLQTVFFFALGLGIVHVMHKDVAFLVQRLATSLRFDPEGKLVTLLMSKAGSVVPHRLLQLGLASFFYSAVTLVEGTGLLLQKVWAEYFTMILTILFLPWEFYELVKEATLFRVGLLVANMMVSGYLLWLLRRRGRL